MRFCWLTVASFCAAAWDAGDEVALDAVAQGEKKTQIWRVTDCKKAGLIKKYYTGCRFYNGHSYLAVNLESFLYLRNSPGGDLVLKSHVADDDLSKPPDWAKSQRWDLIKGSDGRYTIRSMLHDQYYLMADGSCSRVTLERQGSEWNLSLQGVPTRVVDSQSSCVLSRPPGVMMQVRSERRSQLWIWDSQGDASSVKLQNVETRLFLDADTFRLGTVTAWKEQRQNITMDNQRWLFGGRLWWRPLQLYPTTVRLANGLFTDRCLAAYDRQVEVHVCKDSSDQLWDVEVMLERHTGGRRIVRLVNVDTSEVLAADVEPSPGRAGWTDLAVGRVTLTAVLVVLAACACYPPRGSPAAAGPCAGLGAGGAEGAARAEAAPAAEQEPVASAARAGQAASAADGPPDGTPDAQSDGQRVGHADQSDDLPVDPPDGPPDGRPASAAEEGHAAPAAEGEPGRAGPGRGRRAEEGSEEPRRPGHAESAEEGLSAPAELGGAEGGREAPRRPHVFFSLRFDEAKAAARVLKELLERLGYSVFLCEAEAGDDIFKRLICKNLEDADYAVIFGTGTYGRQTHKVMSTYQEMMWILHHEGEADNQSRLQKFALVKMCERYDEVSTQMALHKAVSYIEWDGSEAAAQKVCDKIHRSFSSAGSNNKGVINES